MNCQRSPLFHYLLAAGLASAATAANCALAGPLKGPTLLFPVVAATLAGLCGGVGAGLFAAALSLAGHDFFVLEPRYGFRLAQRSDLFRLVVLATVSGMMAMVAGNLRRAVRRATAEKARAQESADSLALSYALVTALASAATQDEVTKAIFEKGFGGLGAKTLLISRLAEPDWLKIVQAFGFPGRTADSWERFPITAPLPYAEAVHTGRSVWVESSEELERRYPGIMETATTTDARAWACVPILSQGRVVGSFCIGFAAPQRFNDADKRLLESLAATCGQALERSLLEEWLRAQFAALSAVFDALNVVVYVADPQSYELLFVNSYTKHVFGAGWAGRRCYEYLQAGQSVPCSFCTNDRLIRNGLPQSPHVWEHQNTFNYRWYLCIDRAIPWVDGRLVRLEVAVDITERKEVERFRQQWVDLVSHDLRNPLNSIVLSAQALERALTAQSLQPQVEIARRLLRGAQRMDGMIRDLLESARLESPGLVLNRERFDLVGLAEGLISQLPSDDRERVNLQAPPPHPQVLADASRIERVFENLLSNALKYSPRTIPVLVKISCEGEEAIVSVVDQGTGIPKQHLSQLFERFYRVPGTKAQGLGLGLYIVRLIVERHGGRIQMESEPGQGSRFGFTLPLDGPSAG